MLNALLYCTGKELTLTSANGEAAAAEGDASAADASASGDQQVVGHLKMRVTLARPLTDRMKEVRNQRKRAEQEGFFPGGPMGMGMGAMGMGFGGGGMGFGGSSMGFGGFGSGAHFGGGGGGRGGRGGRGAGGGRGGSGGGGFSKGGFGAGFSGFPAQQSWDASSYGGMGGMSMGGMAANPFGGFAPKPSRPSRGGYTNLYVYRIVIIIIIQFSQVSNSDFF